MGKYIVAIQFVIIIGLIAAYSKNEPVATNPVPIANDDIDRTSPSSLNLPSNTFPVRRLTSEYYADPIGLTSELIGRWYGDTGVDIVFGITTYYTEFLVFEPLTYGIVNPQTEGILDDAEQIFGVRYFRQIISNSKNDPKHPFAPNAPIHEETGYLLFMFEDNSDGTDASFYRVVKSIAIPRGQSVLAKAEYDSDSVDSNVSFDANEHLVEYVLRAGDVQKDKNYQVMNGDYTEEIGMVPSFMQSVRIDLKNHVFAYNQSSPIWFHGKKTEHDNNAVLTKLNI